MDTRYTGNKIAEKRKEMGSTQKDIAEKLHVSVAAVSKWERGLNYPDLSLMEPLAEILGITVSELLGLENETADRIIKNIAEISANEKNNSQKVFWKRLGIVTVTALIFIFLSFAVFLSITNNSIMKKIFELSGGMGLFNLLALLLGLMSWSLAITSILSRKNKKQWKKLSIFSLLCCAVSLHIPTLASYLVMRFEYISTVEDVIGAYYFGSAVLLLGTVLFNLCSFFIHKEKI